MKPEHLAIVQHALALYGASLSPDGSICRNGKTLGVYPAIKGKRLRFEADGNLLSSGPIAESTVCGFVERFWFWERI